MIKFGTDGWRAVIAEEFTFDNVKIVSQGIADYLGKNKNKKRVVIGYDCRFFSKEFAQTVACVLAANKIKVMLSDRQIPTPTVSFHCLYGKYDLGVMITASHNPYSFNGLKIKTKEGGAADRNVTDEVEKLFYKTKPKFIDFDLACLKGLIKVEDLTVAYTAFFKKFVDLNKIRKLKVKVLVDNMYGAGGHFVRDVLGKCGIKIDYLHDDFNPSFKGIPPEPIAKNLKEIIAKVKKDKYDFGVVLDGDADRIAMIDGNGEFIGAQTLLPLLAIHMIKNRKEKGGIGKTVVGSNIIDDVALSLNAACYETAVGFKYISNLFRDNLICIGGEEAGGIGYSGYIPERDGSMSFLLVLEMIAYEKKNFNELLNSLYKKYGKWYYYRTSAPVKNLKNGLNDLKIPEKLFGKKIERINNADGIKLITKDTWLMFRASGTEPIVRIYAESKSQKESNQLLDLGKKMIDSL